MLSSLIVGVVLVSLVSGVPDTRPVLKLPGHGGLWGRVFDDIKHLTGVTVRSIAISSGKQVDSIQVVYALPDGTLHKAPRHGFSKNSPVTVTLAEDEYVEKIEGSTNGFAIDQVYFTTYRPVSQERRVYGPFGSKVGKTNFTFEGPVIGFHGRAGLLLNNIGVYSLSPMNKSHFWGWPGGRLWNFDENPDLFFPPVVKISKLRIRHGDRVDAIQAEYQLYGGRTRWGKQYGRNGGNLTTLEFDSDEHIIGVKGRTDDIPTPAFLTAQMQLTIVTKKSDSSIRNYGPFGTVGVQPFSFEGNIVSLAGQAKHFVGGIQFYYY